MQHVVFSIVVVVVVVVIAVVVSGTIHDEWHQHTGRCTIITGDHSFDSLGDLDFRIDIAKDGFLVVIRVVVAAAAAAVIFVVVDRTGHSQPFRVLFYDSEVAGIDGRFDDEQSDLSRLETGRTTIHCTEERSVDTRGPVTRPGGPGVVFRQGEIGHPDCVLVQTGLCRREASLKDEAVFAVGVLGRFRPVLVEGWNALKELWIVGRSARPFFFASSKNPSVQHGVPVSSHLFFRKTQGPLSTSQIVVAGAAS
mmetsp:Transcript_24698/g.52623  ORF Transcript_24698/g.52623 Transcript_24698/m.52623 type:complete len:252 (-) Transcript_24698:207-962(-)